MIALFDQYAACLFCLGALSLSALLGWVLHLAQQDYDTQQDNDALGRAVGSEAVRQERKYGRRYW